MKALVIGATGRVGTEVVKALLQRGADVRALTATQAGVRFLTLSRSLSAT